MKTNLLRMGAIAAVSLSMFLTSCSKEDDSVEANETSTDLTAEQSKLNAEADKATDEVFNLIDIAYAEQEEDAGRNASLFSDCVTITISSENGTTFVSLDFGFGCELNNGAIVSGIVNLTYGPIVAGTRTITYTFDNFTYNDKGVAGGGSIYRQRNNANGNPQSTVNKTVQITFTNGVVAEVVGTRVAEWIEGVGSGTWMDNVVLVTGDRDIDFSSGFSHYAIVTEALRREATCAYFVSGTIEITRNNGEGTLDFGDGTCDNQAVLTVNGQEIIIILGN
ncbi:MAG: hypothetical protein HKN48_07720 [Flavobacteriaceae bacterium]|nr:hypothetical protein [Flavobacteriaceae bacterium]